MKDEENGQDQRRGAAFRESGQAERDQSVGRQTQADIGRPTRMPESDAVRNRAAAEEQEGDGPGRGRGFYEEKQDFAEVSLQRTGTVAAEVVTTMPVIVFEEPVRGPVLVGAGRFRGYGLCRPMDNEAGPFSPEVTRSERT